MIKDKNILNIINNQKVLLPVVIISNLMPLYGVINYGWTIFSVVYIYWFELLIITFFQFLKILLAEGNTAVSFFVRCLIGIRFLFVRIGIFLFYLLFIIVFLGLMANMKSENTDGIIQMGEAIFLKSDFFRITVLSFIFYNFLEFLLTYILTGKYKTANANDYSFFLDIRIIVVHIVVVLGTFLYKVVTDKLHFNQQYAMIACVSLFIVVKIIADMIRQGNTTSFTNEKFDKDIL